MDKILLALAALGTKFDNFLASNATRAENEPKLKEASDLLAAAKGEMAAAATAIADRDATIAKLTADLAAATEKLTASATAAAAALVTEAKRTDETLAALGVDPKSIPAPSAAGSTVTANALVAQLNAITDPVKRTQFFRANKQAIYAARNSN